MKHNSTHTVLLAVIACVVGCGDPPTKVDTPNAGANSAPNSDQNAVPNSDLLAWCSANQQYVECARDDDDFQITMEIVEGCGQFDRPDCGVTAAMLQTCVDVIGECPQTGTTEEVFSECLNDEVWCTFSPANSSTNNANNANNANNTMTTGVVYGDEFLAITNLLRDNCLLAGCHGGAAATGVFVVSTGSLATPAEIEAALDSPIPAGTGNRLVTPGSPEQSAIYEYVSRHRQDLLVDLLAEEEEAIFNWILGGAVYRE